MSDLRSRRRDMARLSRYAKQQRSASGESGLHGKRGASGRLRSVGGPPTLWELAGKVYHEAILQGSLSAAGSNRQRLVERMDRDSRYIRRQARMVQILGSFYLLLVALLPAATLGRLAAGETFAWNSLVATLAGTIHLFVQTGYLMILTLIATAEILAPELYRWPESLPLQGDQAGLLRTMALAREFLLPLIMIAVSYPVVAGITGGVVSAALTLSISILHALFTLSITVLASWRLRRTLREVSGNDRRAGMVRVLTMVGYGLGIILVMAVMQVGTGLVDRLFDVPRLSADGSVRLLTILSILPLPTAPASLVAALVARHGEVASALPIWMPLLGSGLYGAATLLVFRAAWRLIGRRDEESARRSVQDVTAEAPRHDKPETSVVGSTFRPVAPEVSQARWTPLTRRSPRAAFRRQIFQTATRDTQMLLGLLFPIVLPIGSMAGPAMSGMPGVNLLYALPVAAALLGGWMLIHGLSRVQTGTGPLEASLPLVERDRAFPRLSLCAIVPAIGTVLSAVVLLPADLKLQGVAMAAVPAIAVPVGFLMKTALFGRIRGPHSRVVVEEVYIEHRFLKWVAAIGSVMLVVGAFVAGSIWAGHAFGSTGGTITLLGVSVVAAALARFAAGRVFPPGPTQPAS